MTKQLSPLELELDEPRSRQRRILRFLPDSILKDLANQEGQVDSLGYSDKAIAEVALRKTADELLTAIALAGDILDRFETTELDFARRAVLTRAASQSAAFNSRKLRELADASREQPSSSYVETIASEPVASLLSTVVPLLVLADLYADDGYRDPRLTPAPHS